MECSIIKVRKLHYGGLNKFDDFKNSIGFDKFCLMEYSMPREKKCSMEFFKNLIFGELHILNKIWPYGVLHTNVINLRYGVLQKYQVPRTPCPSVNFTAWSTPYACKKYDLWSTPDKRLIFVVWSTIYDIFSVVPGVVHSTKMEWTLSRALFKHLSFINEIKLS